ncbi:hypothetical protein D3C78_826480 [compost metagenome]
MIKNNRRARPSVEGRHGVIGLSPKLDPRHITQSHDRPVAVGADNDVAEFRGIAQPALCKYGELQLLSVRDRRRANLACGRLGVLGLDCGAKISRGNTQRLHAIGVHPDSHAVGGAKDAGVSNTRNAGQRIPDVDRGIIADKERILGALRRIDRDPHQHA